MLGLFQVNNTYTCYYLKKSVGEVTWYPTLANPQVFLIIMVVGLSIFAVLLIVALIAYRKLRSSEKFEILEDD